MMKNSEGFTLLELVIVIFIVGVLSSVAKPYYIEYRTKAERQNAIADILSIADYLKDYRAVNSTYTGATPPVIDSNFYTATYTINANTFVIQQTPKQETTQKGDGVICYNHLGQKLWRLGNTSCNGLSEDSNGQGRQ